MSDLTYVLIIAALCAATCLLVLGVGRLASPAEKAK